jgi:hypothetical protein
MSSHKVISNLDKLGHLERRFKPYFNLNADA